jgi:hypothetical protein
MREMADCRARGPEAGYALLLVFLMAAAVAIGLYAEIPSVGFQVQRRREQLLVSRGEQYSRGVRVFFLRYNRYPASLDELECLDGRRFLRHRFADPITGRNVWRMVRISQAGFIADQAVAQAGKDASHEQAFGMSDDEKPESERAAQQASPTLSGGSAGAGVQLMSAGAIAGVASLARGKSIMAVNESRLYRDWRFIFDPRSITAQVGLGGSPQAAPQSDNLVRGATLWPNGAGPYGGTSLPLRPGRP